MNSLVIVLFLSGMVAMITIRSLHKDIARYNTVENSEEAQEEFGWKLVHGLIYYLACRCYIYTPGTQNKAFFRKSVTVN